MRFSIVTQLRGGVVALAIFAAAASAVTPPPPSAYPEVKLAATDGVAGDDYGHSIAVDGDYAAVGVPYSNALGENSGAVYLYYRNQGGTGNWGLVKKITASDGAAGDLFGWSVSLSGEFLVVGAPAHTDSSAGAVYAFAQNSGGTNNWGAYYSKIMLSNPKAGDEFGYSVAVSGSRLAIGAPFRDAPDTNAGIVAIYHSYYGWSYDKEITAMDATRDGEFGKAVSLSGDNLVVGAPGVAQAQHDGRTGEPHGRS